MRYALRGAGIYIISRNRLRLHIAFAKSKYIARRQPHIADFSFTALDFPYGFFFSFFRTATRSLRSISERAIDHRTVNGIDGKQCHRIECRLLLRAQCAVLR